MPDDMIRRRIVANRDMLTARLHLLELSAARQAEALARSAPGLPATFGVTPATGRGRTNGNTRRISPRSTVTSATTAGRSKPRSTARTRRYAP